MYIINDISYAEKAIRSVMDQTLKEIEILIVDGGSTDGTLELIEQLSSQDSRIRVIHSEPGVGHQFNTGLKAAVGEYIGICESDDYILSDMYEKQYELAKHNQLDALRSNKMRFCEMDGKEFTYQDITPEKIAFYDSVIDPSKDVRFLKLGSLGIWSGIYRREFLLKEQIWMNETRGAAYQDTTFAFLVATKARRAMLMEDIFYYYRVDNPNSSSNKPRRLSMMLDEYDLLKQRMKKDGLFEKYKEIYLSWKTNACIWFYEFLADNLKKEFIPLLYQNMNSELREENFTRAEVCLEREKGLLQSADGSYNDMKAYMEQYDAAFNELKRRLSSLDPNRKIIIFGQGNMGKLVQLYMQHTNRQQMVYTDNNERLWGKTVDGIEVISPPSAVRQFSDGFYVVANVVYAKNIKSQLLQLHVPEENIAVCDNYDLFLKKILLKSL